ncbi:hypothetical protein K0817_017740 [Microbacterium sp. HD4P20]|uniref:hypothetical protein n=1 Tax=Microbacterium sp. HD4P20 TaxID=2864874 RepID=UPI0020A4C886|nr:hypothetical protein [Microbacterium sp. HD4P20]MCP2638398.1 hypothetical protein [Microbacterium sp. HD4P20]
MGTGALGLDLDNSDRWVKNEEDIRKVTGAVAKAASYLPVPYIGSVINGIPEVVGDVWRGPGSVFLPVAGDRLQLASGCVLEMRRTFADGVETGGRLIRCAGPASVADILHNPPIGVELERPLHIG